MTLIDLPKPHGLTLKERYEYAKFIMLCNAPTLDLLRFFDKEKENFTYQALCPYQQEDQISSDEIGRSKLRLVWENGELYSDIGLCVYSCGYNDELGCRSYDIKTYFGLDWANHYEKKLLERAVDTLIALSEDRTRQKTLEKIKEKNMQERKLITKWLEEHEQKQ